MKYITVKGCQTDFQISRVAFGTGSAMQELTKAQYFELFDLYAEKGGNVLDTAPGYCGGRSERYIGEWIRARNNRDKIFISTKACHAFAGEPSRLTRKDMLDDLSLSLSQLGTDYVDLFWIHNDDPAIPVEGIMEAVDAVIRTGRVLSVGCSNWTTARIAAANAYAAKQGLHGFWANQIQWSLARVAGEEYAKRYNALTMDDAAYDWYLNNGVAVFAFSSMAQGFFSIAAKGGIEALPEETRRYFASPDNLIRLERVKRYMAERHVPAAAPVLGYLTGNRLPCVALTSAQTTEVLKETMSAADFELTADEADALFRV